MTDKMKTEELNEGELDQVTGGVGMLLPAVQSARESARATASPSAVSKKETTGGYQKIEIT